MSTHKILKVLYLDRLNYQKSAFMEFANITMYIYIYVITFDVQRGKKSLIPYSNSKGPDKHAHPCSLIWAFSV